MNPMFIDILQKLAAEHGKEALLNSAKCKAFLADYTKGEYKKEKRFLLQALESDVQKAIYNAEDIAYCKKIQTDILMEDYGLAEDVAADVVDTLALILREKEKEKNLCKNCRKELQDEWQACPFCGTSVKKQSVNFGEPAPAQTQQKIVSEQILKEGMCYLTKPSSDSGSLLLYGDRLEWRGNINQVFHFAEVASIKKSLFAGNLEIALTNGAIIIFQPIVGSPGVLSAIIGGWNGSIDKEVDSWCSTIMSVRYKWSNSK